MNTILEFTALISFLFYKGLIFVYLGYMAGKIFERKSIHYKIISMLMTVGIAIELLKFFEKVTATYYEKDPNSLDYYAMIAAVLVVSFYGFILSKIQGKNPSESSIA